MEPWGSTGSLGARREIVVLPDAPTLAAEAARRFTALATEAVSARGRFAVALAGGSTPAALYRLLAGPPYAGEIDWPHVLVFFGDERCVPAEHPDSNYRMANETLLAHVPLGEGNVYRMPGEVSSDVAAAQYADDLRLALGAAEGETPSLDLVLLGMGDDGHTASLFPGMPALEEVERMVIWTPVPTYVRPAVPRLTLTLPVLNAARHVMFLVAGAAKAPAAGRVLGRADEGQMLPAARVRPIEGKLTWLLDQAARQIQSAG